MKTSLIITALLITLAAVQTCKGEAETPKPKPQFILVIEDEFIKICDDKGDDLGRVTVDTFRDLYAIPTFQHPFTQDALRHFALDAVAAFVAGGGYRDHSVDPDTYVMTYDESNARGNEHRPITITIEQGTGFAMLRDSLKPCGETCKGIRYRAEIYMIDSKAIQQAMQPVI
jgi:hypothetical protein